MVGAAILSSIYLGNLFIQNESSNSIDVTKAAIIDQLYHDKPNEYYQQRTLQYLEEAGYEVDIFITEDITVDFYKNLPSKNYEFIVIRTHSIASGTVEPSPSLLTGEIYSEKKYIREQLFGQVGKAVPFLFTELEEIGSLVLSNQTYFTVGSNYVDKIMEGQFPGSIIILGGCDTSSDPLLAESLLSRGASAVIGWDGLITSYDNDRAIIGLLNAILENDVEAKTAVESIMKDFNYNSKYTPKLQYYS